MKKPQFESEESWKAKARITACGNFEYEDLFFMNLSHRSEVPDAFMLHAMLAYGAERPWSIGSADLSTAFLNAELDDKEDGIYIVTPPQFLIDLGLEQPGIVWKLNNALYGLKRAPKKWEMCRNAELKTMKYDYSDDGSYLWLDQCPSGKNIWEVMRYDATMKTSTLEGMMLLCVDDIFMLAPTKTIQSTLTAIQNKWK